MTDDDGQVALPLPNRAGTYTKRTEQLANRARGYTTINQLIFLTGRKLDDVVFAYVHALRPSSVRLCQDAQNDDSRLWRVTIFLNANGTVKCIDQEVEVALPDGVKNGFDLDRRP